MKSPACFVILPAAGVGRRMQASGKFAIPKQYLQIQGKTILQRTLEKLDRLEGLAAMVLVTGKEDVWLDAVNLSLSTPLRIVAGGSERMHSVLNGLLSLKEQAHEADWVLVHDVVRPCVSLADIELLRRELNATNSDLAGGLLATPIRETLKKAGKDSLVDCTVPREEYWCAATPQMFRYQVLTNALTQAVADQVLITDEAHAVERLGHQVKLVEGRADNIKITRVEDLALAEHILQSQEAL